MFWTIVALVMTVLMGGIIAYNGDLIGRKYGKRRVSMFGLRPKYTAILITSVTGVMISALTTGVLFLLVTPVREIILDGERAIADNARFQKENKLLVSQNAAQKALNAQQALKLASNQQDLHKIEQQKRKADNLRDKAVGQLSATEAQLKKEQAELARVRNETAKAKAEIARLNAERTRLLAANTTLKKKNGELVVLNETLSTKNVDLTRQNKDLSRLNNELAQYNNRYQQQNSELAQQNDSLVRENDRLAKANTVYKRDNDLQREMYAELSKQNSQLTRDNKQLETQNSAMKTMLAKLGPHYNSVAEAYWAARNKRVAIHKDEDLARIVIPANSSPEKIRTAVDELLHNASDSARAKGAGTGERLLAVQVVDREYIAQTPGGGVETIPVSAAERVDAVVSRLAWQPISACLLAIAVANSSEAEPAAVDLQPFPNKLVYTKGQVVTRKWLNGTQSPDRVFNELVLFLKEMGQQALEKGMIPRMDPITGEPQVGSLGGADLIKLVERVKEVGGRVQIRAITKRDIYAADPLDLEFRIEP